MLTLSDRADADTAAIPPDNTPSLKELAAETGLNKATVSRYLPELELLGWVLRDLPDAAGQARHDRTGYRLAVGRTARPGDFETAKSGSRHKTPAESCGATPAESPGATPGTDPGSRDATSGVASRERSESRGATPYLKDDDRNDRHDLSAAADAAAHDDPGALFAEPRASPKPETEGQRVNRLTTIYAKRVPLSKFVAVAGIVRQAVRATVDNQPIYDDQQITDALNRLADEKRSVTIEALRIAIEGPPTSSNTRQTYQGHTDPAAYSGGLR